jgi:hypothetical protein
MEAVYSFETAANFYRTIRSYISEDDDFLIHCCEDLNPNTLIIISYLQHIPRRLRMHVSDELSSYIA